MVCIWSTSVELIWGVASVHAIIKNMHIWASRLLKPKIQACIFQVARKLPREVPKTQPPSINIFFGPKDGQASATQPASTFGDLFGSQQINTPTPSKFNLQSSPPYSLKGLSPINNGDGKSHKHNSSSPHQRDRLPQKQHEGLPRRLPRQIQLRLSNQVTPIQTHLLHALPRPCSKMIARLKIGWKYHQVDP